MTDIGDASRWTVRNRHVTHERLDDEVIAIDLESGLYFAMVGPAADVWTATVAGVPVEEVATMLAERYGAPADVVGDDVRSFVATLVEHQLLVARGEEGPSEQLALPPRTGDGGWATPVLERYDDMADLVLLDPIHQVDEAGWPHLPADA